MERNKSAVQDLVGAATAASAPKKNIKKTGAGYIIKVCQEKDEDHDIDQEDSQRAATDTCLCQAISHRSS